MCHTTRIEFSHRHRLRNDADDGELMELAEKDLKLTIHVLKHVKENKNIKKRETEDKTKGNQ